jgi:hypothetical protein
VVAEEGDEGVEGDEGRESRKQSWTTNIITGRCNRDIVE